MKRALHIAAALLLSGAAPGPHKILRNSPALEFSYAWPAEAAAIPTLDRRLRAEAASDFRRHLKLGRENEKLYAEQHRGSASDFYSKLWTTAGRTRRLLSLQYRHSTYTGGAHPNTDFGALLWDRREDRELAPTRLFLSPNAFAALTRAIYCKALDRERLKRRQGQKLELAEFNECPKFSDLAIAPVDTDGNGRFDAIAFVASPYTAGPYAEGAYEITLPVTSRLIAAIRPEFRDSFERQRQ